jgi:hypothetical protein
LSGFLGGEFDDIFLPFSCGGVETLEELSGFLGGEFDDIFLPFS